MVCPLLNPVRAGIVAHPGEYRWSSYRYNGHGERADLLSHHSVYRGLLSCNPGVGPNFAWTRIRVGRTSEERAAYRELFRHELEPVVDQIRQASNGNFALGNQRFKEEIAAMLGHRVTPGKAGRPGKKIEMKEGDGQTWSVPYLPVPYLPPQ